MKQYEALFSLFSLFCVLAFGVCMGVFFYRVTGNGYAKTVVARQAKYVVVGPHLPDLFVDTLQERDGRLYYTTISGEHGWITPPYRVKEQHVEVKELPEGQH